MVDFSRSDIEKISKLAYINLSQNEINMYTKHISSILEWIDMLHDINVDGIEPMYGLEVGNPELRDDEVIIENTREEIFENAPKHKGGYFVVPKVIE